jgi:signal transduction histidine kinase
MRSPLNKIFALVNLLQMADHPLSEEQEKYLLNMEMILSDGLQRMRNLMDLRAIENDQIKVHWQEIDMAALITKLVREHQVIAERKGLKLTLSTEPVTTMTDRLIFSRIFEQVLSNALKFSPTKSEIKLGLKAGEDGFSLSIVDGGYGIGEADQRELYKKFKILSTPTARGESKTGLGLYIAQFNAGILGGKISYSNESGSTFIIEIPYSSIA